MLSDEYKSNLEDLEVGAQLQQKQDEENAGDKRPTNSRAIQLRRLEGLGLLDNLADRLDRSGVQIVDALVDSDVLHYTVVDHQRKTLRPHTQSTPKVCDQACKVQAPAMRT